MYRAIPHSHRNSKIRIATYKDESEKSVSRGDRKEMAVKLVKQRSKTC